MTDIPLQHSIQLRVRYSETDAMGLLHHSNYLAYFEVGRTELFRHQGGSYRRMEELGLYFVVASVKISFKRPAKYDDLLDLTTSIQRQTPARIEHHYELCKDGDLLAEADTVIACVGPDGVPQRIPEDLLQQTME